MPTRLCLHPRCPEPATHRGRCHDHARALQREREPHARLTKTEQRKVYNSKRWKTTRNKVIFDTPLCVCCGNIAEEVDHITPLIQGGDPYALNNLQPLCRNCHFAKTNHERYARHTTNTAAPLVVIVGQAGVGKTTVRQHLGPLLGMATIGPDDTPNRWDDVYRLAETTACIVECCKIPRTLRRLMDTRPTTVVLLTAPKHVRRERLTRQGHDEATVHERLQQDGITYPDQRALTPHQTHVAEGPAAALAKRIALAIPTNPVGKGRVAG